MCEYICVYEHSFVYTTATVWVLLGIFVNEPQFMGICLIFACVFCGDFVKTSAVCLSAVCNCECTSVCVCGCVKLGICVHLECHMSVRPSE